MTLNDVMSSFRSAFLDWKGFLIDPKFTRVGNRGISWNGDTGDRPGVPLLLSDVIRLSDTGQYSFRIGPECSLLQLHYQWGPKGELVKAGLAYLGKRALVEKPELLEPPPDAPEEDALRPEEPLPTDAPGAAQELPPTAPGDSAGEMIDVGEGELLGVDEDVTAPWLRVDYDPAARRGVLHHDAHLHVVGFPSTRVPVNGVPTPRQFVEFIVGAFYPETYRAHRLDHTHGFREPTHIDNLNVGALYTAGTTPLHSVVHVSIPGCAGARLLLPPRPMHKHG